LRFRAADLRGWALSRSWRASSSRRSALCRICGHRWSGWDQTGTRRCERNCGIHESLAARPQPKTITGSPAPPASTLLRPGKDRARQLRRSATLGRGGLALGLAAAMILLISSGAAALPLRAGNILINADGGFTPTALPRHTDAPITIHGGGKISTVSGALPPVIKTITLEYDRHGHVETTGLAVCTKAKLVASTVAAARHRCPGAIVGKGHGRGVVVFPEQAPIPASSPITIFNGPRLHGNPSVLAHFYTTVPAPTAFVIPIEIERIHKGLYGYRTEAKIPPIAGGAGIPLAGWLKIGRRWTVKGTKHSYINARCETGRLQARGEFGFDDGTKLSGTFLRPCSVRP
jgi:hypothetical protein